MKFFLSFEVRSSEIQATRPYFYKRVFLTKISGCTCVQRLAAPMSNFVRAVTSSFVCLEFDIEFSAFLKNLTGIFELLAFCYFFIFWCLYSLWFIFM